MDNNNFSTPGSSLEEKRRALLERKLRQRRAERSERRNFVRVSRDGFHPVSYQQEDIWFLHQMTGDHAVYNIAFQFRLHGALDIFRIQRAIMELVSRHEPLRTRFIERDGIPYQVIDAVPDPSLFCLIDHPVSDPAEREAWAECFVGQEANRGFDLATGPLFRCSIVRFSSDEAVLAIVAHHIVTDGWSFTTILDELEQLYGDPQQLRAHDLSPLPIQAVDHAVWQKSSLSDEIKAQQLAYWARRLAGVPGFDFPTDRPRPATMTWSGALSERKFAPELGSRLEELARSERMPLLAVLLAGFLSVISSHSGQEDLAVGSVFNGRTRPELEPMVGLFATTLVLRSSTEGDPSFLDLAVRCQEAVLGALDNQDLPLGKIVEAIKPFRDPGKNPLFQISFSLDTAQTSGLDLKLHDLEVEAVQIPTKQSRLDMTVTVSHDEGAGMSVQIEYNTMLFDAVRIEELTEQLEFVLSQGVARPDRPVSELLPTRIPTRKIPALAVPMEAHGPEGSGKIEVSPAVSGIEALSPATTAEQALALLWGSVLGVPARKFDREDAFFVVGGTSLSLMVLISAIRSQMGVDISVRDMYAAPTLREMALIVERAQDAGAGKVDRRVPSPLVPIKPTGSKSPFFCVHAVGGSVFPYVSMAEFFHPEQPIYGLESLSLTGLPAAANVPEIAAEYVRHIRLIQRSGPYLFGGWSSGGSIAFEMARLVAAEGEAVGPVILLDSWVPPGLDALPSMPERLESFLCDFALLQNRDPETIVRRATRAGSAAGDVIEALLQTIEEAGLAPTGMRGDLRHRIEVFLNNQRAFLTHRTSPAGLSVALFATDQSRRGEIASEWRSVALDGVGEYPIPGDHYTILSGENVSAVVDQIQLCLDTQGWS
ncbi:condensation domain-containing protein [Streptomyces bikiniensis]|uniref:Condensation domain-containing protein n=1 Tax=Streptomyces bikiniensis TaxID=1896 RepID=A0ABW8D4N6_STRBI